MAFAIKGYADDIAANRPKVNYPKTPEGYFVDQLRTADNVIDSDDSQWPVIEQILMQFGVIEPTKL